MKEGWYDWIEVVGLVIGILAFLGVMGYHNLAFLLFLWCGLISRRAFKLWLKLFLVPGALGFFSHLDSSSALGLKSFFRVVLE